MMVRMQFLLPAMRFLAAGRAGQGGPLRRQDPLHSGQACAALLLLGLVTVPAVQAAEPTPSITVELGQAQVYEGQPVLYRVTLNDCDEAAEPELSGFDDFDITPLGTQTFQSQEMRIVNGQREEVVTRGKHCSFRLVPRKTGVLTIPAPSVKTGGRVIQGEKRTLRVIPAAAQDIVLAEIISDRRAVYPSQAFTITLRVSVKGLPAPYTERDPLSVQARPAALEIPWVRDERLPEGIQPQMDWQRWLGTLRPDDEAGFSINNYRRRRTVFAIPEEEPSSYLGRVQRIKRRDKSGKEVDYWQYEYPRRFVGQKPGTYRFGPASVHGPFAVRLADRGLLGEEIYAVAKPIEVVVNDVPEEGRPTTFTGAIGRFQLQADLEPKRVRVGDPMTLTLTLTGDGTLEATGAPDLRKVKAIADGFRLYEATEETKGNTRRFTYSLRPTRSGVTAFPAVELAYFDTQLAEYVTLRTEPIPIEVIKAVRLSSDQIVTPRRGQGSEDEVEARREGIYANITDPSALRDETVHPGPWLAGMVVLAGTYLAIALGAGRFNRLAGDKALVRRRQAKRRARAKLLAGLALLEAGQIVRGADALGQALTGLVADLLDLAEAGLTPRDVCEQLRRLSLPEELIQRTGRLLDACDAARYGALDQSPDCLGHEAEAVLEALLRAVPGMLPRSLKLKAALGLFLMILLGCGRPVDPDVVRAFQQAQHLFDHASTPDDFLKAASLYQQILDQHIRSGAVLYNQGNAYMRAGYRGRAIAAYRQAQRYRPRDSRLDANLRYALGDDASAVQKKPLIEYLLIWQNWLSYPEKFHLAVTVAVATCATGLAGMLWRSHLGSRLAIAGLVATLVLAVSAGYDGYRFECVTHGVIVAKEAIARKGNAISYEPAFTAPLAETTEFVLVERRGDWLLIRLAGAQEGWVKAEEAVLY